MVLLTPDQLHEIRAIIERHHDAFIANILGADGISKERLEELRRLGILAPRLEAIKEAYLYGQIQAIRQNPAVANMPYAEFKAYLARNPVPLGPAEQNAVKIATFNAGQYCKGLGNRVSVEVNDDIVTKVVEIEADQELRERTEATIREATAENIARREGVSKLKSDLGWATGDWSRDWARIAVTEKQNAMQQGMADHFKKRYGADSFVSKLPAAGACQHCIRLHIGPDGAPRIFKLSTLERNGTNVGRKAAEWQVVVGTVHPNCQCEIVQVPAGFGYNDEGQLVPGGTLGQRYETEGEIELALLQEMDLRKGFELEGRVDFQGLPMAIETDVGSVRRWTAPDGSTGETRMSVAYGFIEGTGGADGEELDVFVGPDPRAELVYLVEQQNPATGLWDEQKAMLGFSNQADAEACYRRHYDAPDDYLLYATALDMPAFKRWIAETGLDMGAEVALEKNTAIERPSKSPSFVIPLSGGDLVKAEVAAGAGSGFGVGRQRGGKYIKRVPYTGKDGKKHYRYFYHESAVARDVAAGEKVKIGETETGEAQFAKVNQVEEDGSIHMTVGETEIHVAPDQWEHLLANHYGQAYHDWAEKRARQSVDAVLKHVPREHLADLKGETDKERLEDLKTRVPQVYEKLKKSFDRAGVNPFRAKSVLSASLERRGWEPEARAAVIGNVITKRNADYRTTIQAAENMAAGKPVTAGHVGAVTELLKPKNGTVEEQIKATAEAAEKELAKLSELLAKARGGDAKIGAEALAAALSSTALQKLNMIAQAFPGTKDRAIAGARNAMLEAQSLAPATSGPKSTRGRGGAQRFVRHYSGAGQGAGAGYDSKGQGRGHPDHGERSFGIRTCRQTV
jgi:hypothetical protein